MSFTCATKLYVDALQVAQISGSSNAVTEQTHLFARQQLLGTLH
jgi:hypothetical protein